MAQTFLFLNVIRKEKPVRLVQLYPVAKLRDVTDFSQRLQVPIILVLSPRMHPLHGALLVPCGADYTQYFGLTSVYLFSSSLENLLVPQDFYSSLSVSVERSCWSCIRWCGAGRFKEQGQCFFYWPKRPLPICLLLYFPFFFLSVGWYCGAGVFELIGCQSLSPCLALPTLLNNNNKSDQWKYNR